jgi:excinuclease UvrABC nuclease subunit
MLSYDLRSEGFVEWRDFNFNAKDELLNDLPDKSGVYVIRDRKEFGRFIKTSDIVYIGSAPKNTLKDRIKKYFNPEASQATNVRINAWLKRYDSFQISWKELENGTVNNEQKENQSKTFEKKLLNWYEQDHGELPPFNCSH